MNQSSGASATLQVLFSGRGALPFLSSAAYATWPSVRTHWPLLLRQHPGRDCGRMRSANICNNAAMSKVVQGLDANMFGPNHCFLSYGNTNTHAPTLGAKLLLVLI